MERGPRVVPLGAPVIIRAKVFGVGGKFDLNNKWDNGQFVGPATELKGGFVVRDVNGRYLTTMHMKTKVVDVDKEFQPDAVDAILPAPETRVRRKATVARATTATHIHYQQEISSLVVHHWVILGKS